MVQFNVTGSGTIDLTLTDLSAFDGLNFATSGNATVLITAAQATAFGPNAGFTGSTFRDTVQISLTAGQTIDAFAWNLTTWSNTNDAFDFRDSTGNEVITGSFGSDIIRVSQGVDTVAGLDGTPGSIDRLVVDWASETSNVQSTGSAFSDFSNTQVSFSGIERFDVRVGSGNDNIVTGAGNDSISGGAGNDTLNSGAGAAVIDGGDGTDQWAADFSADATAKTIDLSLAGVQNAGNGTTYANIERLSILGGAGNDRFETRTDNANDGLADFLDGGLGNDTLVVGGGIDTVVGGDGDDLLVVDWSTDATGFTSASATVISDFSNTQVTFSGIERIDIRLGSGNDNVVTGAGNDSMSGGAGNDTLNSGAGAAVIDGGDGTDQWAADFSADATAKTIDLSLAGVQNAGNGTTYANVERLNILGGAGNDRFETRTDNANDGLADFLDGGLGNDTLVVGGGIDTVVGGDGDDLLVVDWSTDATGFSNFSATVISDFANTQVTFSGVERIDIRLGSGNDNVATGAGDDSISGGAGNDTLNSGAGAAVIDGGDGTDQWAADFSADATAKTIDLSLAGVQNAGNGSTYVNVERLNILGGAGNDRFETRTDNANDGLADFLDGGLGNDTLVVGGGIDTVVGGDGDDLLVVDWSTDATGFSNLSATVISDFANTQVTFSGVERIDIRLGSGNDNVATGAGDDSISGGAGNDTLNSGLGRADVRGGDGTDLWVADYSNTGNARSVDLNLTGRQAAGNLNFYEGIERLNITGGGGNDFLFSRIGSPNDGLNDTMNGGNGNDTLGVGGGVDVVDGGIGDDVLFIDWSTDANSFSNSGATVISDFANTQVSFSNIERLDIRLGVGADNVTTGAGNDTVRGGGGNDTLNGGDGIDILDLSDAAGAVTVSFTSATAGTAAGVGADSFQNFERIDLGSFNDTVNGGAGAVEANGNGGRDRMFGGGGNDTLNGGGGGDRLFGDAGQDVMTGGSGNDRFVFRSKSDSGRTEATADTITDFTPGGADQIDLSGIIANDLSPADPFVWMGTDAFTGIGQARYYVSSGNTYVAINTFGNTSPEMLIRLDGEVVLNAADFLL